MSEVKLHLLTPPRLTLKCHDRCAVVLRVYRIEPAVQVGAFQFCPMCGSNNVSQYMDADLDQWESLARDYELPIPVIRQLYEWWQPTHYRNFGDFIREVRSEVEQGRVPAVVQARLDSEAAARERTAQAHRASLPPRPVMRVPASPGMAV